MLLSEFDNYPCSLRQEKSNSRILSRNQSSKQLQPYLSTRPVLTKYSVMPIFDSRKPSSVPLLQRPTFDIESTFNPGNDMAPWSGFAANINKESELRNQVYALQKCSQATYVPESSSNLYNYGWQNNNQVPAQPFPNLFKTETFGPDNKNEHANVVGFALFNNATRQQLKNIVT